MKSLLYEQSCVSDWSFIRPGLFIIFFYSILQDEAIASALQKIDIIDVINIEKFDTRESQKRN